MLLASTNLPVSYRFFPIGNAPENPPYILYFFENSDDVMADDTNYVKVENLVIELYTSGEREFTTEDNLDTLLKSNKLTYQKNEEYIEAISMYRTTYELEVIING